MLIDITKILVIEDNPADYLLLKYYLETTRFGTGHILHAATLEEGINQLSRYNIDVILLDLSLPDSVGSGSYEHIKAYAKDIPVVILSGSHDEDMALEMVKQGAQDYILKDELNARMLEKTILYAIERKKNLAALKLSQKSYQFLFDSNPIPMWIYDMETLRFTMVNNAAVAIYGYTREEFMEMTILDIRPEEEIPKILEFHHASYSPPYPNTAQWLHLKKNGEIIYVETQYHTFEQDNRKVRQVAIYDVTEKVTAKAGLEKSERIFRAVAESFPNGFIDLLDAQYRVLYTNGSEYKALGIDPAKYVGSNFLNQQDPELYNELKTSLQNSLNGETVNFETRQHGNVYSAISAPLNAVEYSDEKIMVITQNITEKNRIEQHLRLLESVVINSSNGVMIVNNWDSRQPEMQIIFANKAQQELTGYSLNELLGSNPRILQGKDTDPAIINRMRDSIRKCVPMEAELINYRKNGARYWVHIAIVPVFNKGVCTHFVGLSKDVTERKNAEQEIKKINERYQMLSKATNDALLDWDINNDSVVWSKAIATVFGYEGKDIMGTNINWWKKRVHEKDRRRVTKKLARCIKNRESVRFDEYLFLSKSGKYKKVYERSYITYDEQSGEPLRMISTLQDITELRNKELQLLEIAQINSHVIRKPVASILGLLSLLDKSEFENTEFYEIIEMLEASTRELDDVIHKISQKVIV